MTGVFPSQEWLVNEKQLDVFGMKLPTGFQLIGQVVGVLATLLLPLLSYCPSSLLSLSPPHSSSSSLTSSPSLFSSSSFLLSHSPPLLSPYLPRASQTTPGGSHTTPPGGRTARSGPSCAGLTPGSLACFLPRPRRVQRSEVAC